VHPLRSVLGSQAGEGVLICSSCGTENEAGAKFCVECAARLALACPVCGTPNVPSAKFCRECAAPLSLGSVTQSQTRPIAAAAPAPIAERRIVSVLFADLVGFTTLAEGRDPEDTRELLSRYFDLSQDVIARYGGVVEKFIGDAVMAVWGSPTAHEDDAERAVRAALELVDAVKSLGPTIQARAGVLTGEAAVTLGATNQGMVAGDLVNTASRLQSVAQPGTVLVGEATQRAAGKAIAFEEAGEQILKGKTSPVPAWRALRVIAQLGGRNRSETLEAPFVGRDDELRMLKDLFHATAREHRARLVSVIGPAGIGKSRLAWEFSKYTDGVVETTYWHAGRSPAYGEGISFWALGEMVRRRAGLLETDDEPTTRAQISETMTRWIPDATERPWIENALLVLLGVGEVSRGGREELFAAWRTFFERIAAEGTVTMVFEDFHYADSGLLDFVDHLLEWSRSLPIYVVTLSRPELLDKRPDWGAGKRNFVSLYLEPLPEAAMRELLAGLVPGLPETAVKAIIARADGMPLYAVETVRMLLAEGKLSLADGVYHPVGDLTNLAVPETLTALIASRLDSLAPADRTLVSDAAVLGQSFTLPGISAVSGLAEEELEPRLRGLVRRELLTLETDPRSPERDQYAFVQALIREVAYNTLGRKDRKTRHLAAARFFESLETDEIAGGLAGHYLAAHANAAEGPEADALAGQARIALRAAAERAAALGSHGQALTFYEQALTVTTDPSEEAELLERAGEAASVAGGHETAEAHLRRGLVAQRDLGDRPAIARATAALGRALLLAFRTEQAIAVLEPAADEFADLSASPAFVALLGQLARAYFLHEELSRAIDVADRTLAAAELADLQSIVADALVTKGTALGYLGRAIEGLGLIATGQAVAESNDLGQTVLRAIGNRSSLERVRDPRTALATARAGLTLGRRLGARTALIISLTNGAPAALRTGEWSWALAELETALAEEVEANDRLLLLESLVSLQALRGDSVSGLLAEMSSIVGTSTEPLIVSSLLLGQANESFGSGRLAEARDRWHRVVGLTAELVPTMLAGAARAALWMGDPAAATDDLAALDASGIHSPAIESDRLTIRAGIAALEGRPAEALPAYREALRAWSDLGLAWDEALCGLDMALLLDAADPEVRAAAASAREILTRLEAKPFLARLEAAMERQASASAPELARSPDPSTV
jgi:class 3 adenylate cyclase/tetratricopeptide (TPR) repeat protein